MAQKMVHVAIRGDRYQWGKADLQDQTAVHGPVGLAVLRRSPARSPAWPRRRTASCRRSPTDRHVLPRWWYRIWRTRRWTWNWKRIAPAARSYRWPGWPDE